MFYHTNNLLSKINEEENGFCKSLSEFKLKFEQLTSEYSKLVVKGENLLSSYRQMALTFNLDYQEELCFGLKNLGEFMKIMDEELAGVNQFFKQPVFDFLNLHAEQTPALLRFIERNQNLKRDLLTTKEKIKQQNIEKRHAIAEDIDRVCSYLNYVMHYHFKSFHLLKSKDMLVKIGREIESHYNRLGEVIS